MADRESNVKPGWTSRQTLVRDAVRAWMSVRCRDQVRRPAPLCAPSPDAEAASPVVLFKQVVHKAPVSISGIDMPGWVVDSDGGRGNEPVGR
jgi:hypothetical protein